MVLLQLWLILVWCCRNPRSTTPSLPPNTYPPPHPCTKKLQLLKIVMLGYTRSVIAGGGAPGSSPGRERLALAGIGAGALAAVVYRLLERRIQDAGERHICFFVPFSFFFFFFRALYFRGCLTASSLAVCGLFWCVLFFFVLFSWFFQGRFDGKPLMRAIAVG